MATHSRFELRCDCGRTGRLLISENDQPYSKFREKYRAEGFNSDGVDIRVEGSISLGEAISKLSLICPDCRRNITEANVVR